MNVEILLKRAVWATTQVCDTTVALLYSSDRSAGAADARALIAWILQEIAGLPAETIALTLNRDRSTVWYAQQRVDQAIDEHSIMRDKLEDTLRLMSEYSALVSLAEGEAYFATEHPSGQTDETSSVASAKLTPECASPSTSESNRSTWTTEQRAVVALWGEHEPTQDLARWARGETAALQNTPSPEHAGCEKCRGWGDYRDPFVDYEVWHRCECGCPTPRERSMVPVPDPLDVEAYRADCACRGVEPGPLPSLDLLDGRERWGIFKRRDGRVSAQIWVGAAWANVVGGELEEFGDGDGRESFWGLATTDDLFKLARLAKAAAEAMR